MQRSTVLLRSHNNFFAHLFSFHFPFVLFFSWGVVNMEAPEGHTAPPDQGGEGEVPTAAVVGEAAAVAPPTNKRSGRRNKRRRVEAPEEEPHAAGETEGVPQTTAQRRSTDVYKYYAQRYRLFSRFDEGVLLDEGSSPAYFYLFI